MKGGIPTDVTTVDRSTQSYGAKGSRVPVEPDSPVTGVGAEVADGQ